MLYFVTAGREIAGVLKKELDMKPAASAVPYPVYQSNEALLCLSGPDVLDIASALSCLLTAWPCGSNGLLISLDQGVPFQPECCPGEWTLCTGFCGPAGRRWYPDLLAAHPFQEGGAAWELPDDSGYWLFQDPGAWAVIHTGSRFLSPHQLLCLRHPDLAAGLSEESFSALVSWVFQTASLLCRRESGLNAEEQVLARRLAEQMCLSHAMALRLRQLLLYQKAARGCAAEGLEELIGQLNTRPCQNKREGKIMFEQLRQLIIP